MPFLRLKRNQCIGQRVYAPGSVVEVDDFLLAHLTKECDAGDACNGPASEPEPEPDRDDEGEAAPSGVQAARGPRRNARQS